jgi:hypothetical protein
MDTREHPPKGDHSGTELEPGLVEVATPEAAMRHFAHFVAEAEDHGDLHLFCHSAVPERILCVLELPARWRARSDGGGVFEARATLSRVYRASTDFACPARLGQRMGVQACTECRNWLEAREMHPTPRRSGRTEASPQSGSNLAVTFRFHVSDRPRERCPEQASRPDTRRLVET